MSQLNNKGQEIFDQTPVTIKVPFDRPLPLHLRLRNQIIHAMSLQQEMSEVETPQEADDFTPDDDPDMWNSPYEGDFDHINKPLNEVIPNMSTSATSDERDRHEEADAVKSNEEA